MPAYILQGNAIHFRQSTLPAQWMTVLASLGIYVNVTGDKRYPYAVTMTESDFLDFIQLAEEL